MSLSTMSLGDWFSVFTKCGTGGGGFGWLRPIQEMLELLLLIELHTTMLQPATAEILSYTVDGIMT